MIFYINFCLFWHFCFFIFIFTTFCWNLSEYCYNNYNETLKAQSCRYKNLAIHSSLYKKQYHTGCTLQHLSIFEICAHQICEMFVYKHTETIEYVKKQPLRKIQTLRVINSRILMIQNVKCSGYQFYKNTNIWKNFQICISVPLSSDFNLFQRIAILDSKLSTRLNRTQHNNSGSSLNIYTNLFV